MDPDTLSLVIGVAAGTAPVAYGYWLQANASNNKNNQTNKNDEQKN